MYRLLSIFALLAILSSSVVVAQDFSGRSNPVNIKVGNPTQPAASTTAPVITWVTPSSADSKNEGKDFHLSVVVHSSVKISEVSIYINDMPLGDSRGFAVVESSQAKETERIINKDIKLNEGDNAIKIVAKDINGLSSEGVRNVKVPISAMAANKMARTDYALIFATDEYDEWSDLVNPVNDAKTIAKELEKNYGFQVELVTNNTTKVVMSKLKEYSKKSYLPNDQLFIFFAGHGQFDEAFKEGYLVCQDSQMDDDGKITYISHSTLRTVINNIPSNHTFLAMDVCFGGTFDPLIARSGYRGGGDDTYNEITNDEFIQRKLRFKTRKYVTSGGKEYVPDGRPGQHSPFARKLLEALRNYGGRDKILTLQEMFTYIERIHPEPRAGEFGDNEPGSDFVFVAK